MKLNKEQLALLFRATTEDENGKLFAKQGLWFKDKKQLLLLDSQNYEMHGEHLIENYEDLLDKPQKSYHQRTGPRTKEAIKKLLESEYILKDERGEYITADDAKELMPMLMEHYVGIFCGIYNDKKMGPVFEISSSARYGKRFFKIRIK